MEGDMHMGEPYEFHADTTELVRLLRTGHYNVKLDSDAWDRIITWVDLNTPRYGSWTENVGHERMANCAERRHDLMKRYAGVDGVTETPDEFIAEDWAAQDEPPFEVRILAESQSPAIKFVSLSLQERDTATRSIDLGNGNLLELVRIPSGKFISGNESITIEQPFWMARDEVTNRQFAEFDPQHDSRLEPGDYLHFDPDRRGTPLDGPNQPVVKVSWEEATRYCEWLSQKTGLDVGLPTEHEWEWACRAGAETPYWYGDGDSDFERYANLADAQFRAPTRSKRIEWRLAIAGQDDGYRVSAPVGSFAPNPWGLHDMHGNVAEWTSSVYGFEVDAGAAKRVICGGSWSDRPRWATASVRWGYREHQKVYNVGFRVIVRKPNTSKSLRTSSTNAESTSKHYGGANRLRTSESTSHLLGGPAALCNKCEKTRFLSKMSATNGSGTTPTEG
jgi:formylglycine-generating enzyme required for sulfatase activity